MSLQSTGVPPYLNTRQLTIRTASEDRNANSNSTRQVVEATDAEGDTVLFTVDKQDYRESSLVAYWPEGSPKARSLFVSPSEEKSLREGLVAAQIAGRIVPEVNKHTLGLILGFNEQKIGIHEFLDLSRLTVTNSTEQNGGRGEVLKTLQTEDPDGDRLTFVSSFANFHTEFKFSYQKSGEDKSAESAPSLEEQEQLREAFTKALANDRVGPGVDRDTVEDVLHDLEVKVGYGGAA